MLSDRARYQLAALVMRTALRGLPVRVKDNDLRRECAELVVAHLQAAEAEINERLAGVQISGLKANEAAAAIAHLTSAKAVDAVETAEHRRERPRATVTNAIAAWRAAHEED